MADLVKDVRAAVARLRWLRRSERLLVLDRPLAAADRIPARLEKGRRWLVISPDLSDPTTTLELPEGIRVRWESLAALAKEDAQVAAAIQDLRTHLPISVVRASPTLGPALARLEVALGGPPAENERNLTWGQRGEVDAVLYGVNAVTFEGFRLKLTQSGLERWPALDPGDLDLAQLWQRHPMTWLLPVDRIDELITTLTAD